MSSIGTGTRRAIETVDKVHDSKGGRLATWATVLIAVVGVIGTHIQAVDDRTAQHDLIEQLQRQHDQSEQRWQAQNAVNFHHATTVFSSNLAAAVESKTVAAIAPK